MEASHSTKGSAETAITIPESKSTKGKGAAAASATITATTKAAPYQQQGGWKRGVAIFNFILRLCALVAALAATTTMGTTDRTLPFFTQSTSFKLATMISQLSHSSWLRTQLLVATLSFPCLSPLSALFVRPHAAGPRLLRLIFDTVLVAFTTAAAASAAAIVYLAHNGNANTNWLAICQQFNDFCQSVSGAVVASFIAAVVFILLVVLSAVAIRRH